MNILTLAVVQMACVESPQDNIARAEKMARQAAADGARLILLPELFERPYFCKTQRAEFYDYALPLGDNPAVQAMQKVAAELSVVLPVSFYERAGLALFNSIAMINSDGAILGVYRKSHIPDGPGYQEKFYFSPGNTGFCVWNTSLTTIGAGICWDQWFPEAARIFALKGAQVLLYPTAIGEEPHLTAAGCGVDTSSHWQNTMRGHAAANMIPLAAANRIGQEKQTDAFGNTAQTKFYGSSFIANETGQIIAQASRDKEEIIHAEFDLSKIAAARAAWGMFRDRRPDLYQNLLSLEGK